MAAPAAATKPQPLLELRDLHVSFATRAGDVPAVRGVNLSLGAGGTAAIYTQVGGPFHLISKIGIRIKAWTNYAPI